MEEERLCEGLAWRDEGSGRPRGGAPRSGDVTRSGDGPRHAHVRRKSSPTRESSLSMSPDDASGDFCRRELTLDDAAGAAFGDRVIDLGEVCRASDIAAVRRACDAVARGEADAVLCRNIGQVELAIEAAVPWEAAAPLNVWNARAARVLRDLGARRVWLPEELSEPDRRAVRSAAVDDGLVIGLEDAPVSYTHLTRASPARLLGSSSARRGDRACDRVVRSGCVRATLVG